MPTALAQKSPRATAPATPTRRARRLPTTRRPCREAWITDPQTLLDAIGSAEACARQQARRVVASCHTPALEPSVAVEPVEPERDDDDHEGDAPGAWGPQLRDDGRIGRASPAGVVVIIRRRRAAA